MSERVLRFGPDESLVGVLTSPAEARAGAPAILLLNAGLIHRVGPNRLHVELARRLADSGFVVLRFDFAGVGDSPTVDEHLSVPERAQANIRAAIDAVDSVHTAEGFVPMGLCSGAFAAHMAAVSNERIVGCVQLDGYIYPTRGYLLRHYGPKLLRPGPWLRLLGRTVTVARDRPPAPEQSAPFAAEMIPREQFASELETLVDRGMRLLFVVTSGGLQEVNYARQLHDSVPEVDLDRHATVRYYPESDHTFTLRRHRDAMMRDVTDWMDRTFPGLSRAAL